MAEISEEFLKYRLLSERPGRSGVELSLGDLPGKFEFVRMDWVSTWLDRLNVVHSREGNLTATRAITAQGRLIWLVANPNFRRAYHSRSDTATNAFDEARTAWSRRAEFRNRKTEMKRILWELRLLRVRHNVTVEDAYASPLCEEGVDGFLRSLGLGRFRRFPGWLIAWLSIFDRQVGMVLYEARKRHELSGATAEGRRQSDPVNSSPSDIGRSGSPDYAQPR